MFVYYSLEMMGLTATTDVPSLRQLHVLCVIVFIRCYMGSLRTITSGFLF